MQSNGTAALDLNKFPCRCPRICHCNCIWTRSGDLNSSVSRIGNTFFWSNGKLPISCLFSILDHHTASRILDSLLLSNIDRVCFGLINSKEFCRCFFFSTGFQCKTIILTIDHLWTDCNSIHATVILSAPCLYISTRNHNRARCSLISTTDSSSNRCCCINRSTSDCNHTTANSRRTRSDSGSTVRFRSFFRSFICQTHSRTSCHCSAFNRDLAMSLSAVSSDSSSISARKRIQDILIRSCPDRQAASFRHMDRRAGVADCIQVIHSGENQRHIRSLFKFNTGHLNCIRICGFN